MAEHFQLLRALAAPRCRQMSAEPAQEARELGAHGLPPAQRRPLGVPAGG